MKSNVYLPALGEKRLMQNDPIFGQRGKTRQMLIVNNFPRGIIAVFYFLSLSLSLFF